MDVGPIFEIAKMIFAPIHEYYNNYRGADERRIILKNKWRDLERRKLDTSSRMEAQLLPGKTPKEEVQGWIQDVEMMNDEIEAIEREAREGKCFSRARIGKLALKKIGEVEELYQRGAFTDSLVIDPPPSNGEIMSTPTLIGESTAKRVMEEIWAWVLDDDVRKIGLYGMGGIGKSTVMEHINNRLLKEKNKFNSVIWVTVSKSLNVIQLQHDIARKLDLNLAKVEDVRERAAKLKAKLEDKNRHVLVLDDMWEAFALEKVGIPEPTSANGCKLVLTTRLLDVCRGMSCKDIKMELLSKEEAQKLFLDKMERDVFNIPNLKPMAKEVLERCAQLPLAIVTIAASFKPLINDYEWRDALEELRTSVIRTNNREEQVLETLKFSYERLKGEKLKQCLLHCALYPEDFKIDKQELIEHLIDEGIIERMKNRQAEFDRGYSILSKLENACLLEGGNDNFVKMHDLVRDMVLQVASPEFMVEGHLGLEDFSDEGKWREDLVKASLMYKDISTIPSNVSPRCPNLSTLLLQGNKSLKNVPDSLFEHLRRLKVLDLSDTAIESLPNSVFSLENLTTLRLRWCENLKQVPSLAKLTALRKLDLEGAGITEVPDGLEMLVNLKFLNLNASELKVMPLGILPKISHLQYLIVYWHSMATIVNEEEMASLKELEAFAGIFDDADKFSLYIRSLENRRLACYQIRAGKWGEGFRISPYRLVGKGVNIIGCNLRRGDALVLPKDVQSVEIAVCHDLKSLCDVPSLNHTSELQRIHLNRCGGIEHVLSFSSSCTLPLLQTLERLELLNLDNLRVLFWKEKAASTWIPSDTFSSLKIIYLCMCSKIKKLFPPGLLLHLHNLEIIRVYRCEQVEEIIGEASDEFEEEIKEEEEGMDTNKITLPNLRVLELRYLPELKTICSSNKVIVCDSLEMIELRECPKVKRLPLSLPRLSNGQLSAPPSLQHVLIYSSGGIWWESLEWDCPDTKNVLQPFFGIP
ncbi:disease resistance protein At4g27190-like [Quercus lobata]|uniref:AAA+ ATPase domain-containing protein n=1 Tax=Quercus lobata TaxID=97700 RepID=A0A7N2MB20_QUELO|nr:disease resistance protein At4g27190-like [Quercus lobata]XP_030931362.1 disease resistance protein At4g27190-like [Quercus lobata]